MSAGSVAIHCKAGLGRTGVLICCYMMKHFQLTAREALGYIRVCRPGSVIGQQQLYLQRQEARMRTAGLNLPHVSCSILFLEPMSGNSALWTYNSWLCSLILHMMSLFFLDSRSDNLYNTERCTTPQIILLSNLWSPRSFCHFQVHNCPTTSSMRSWLAMKYRPHRDLDVSLLWS